MKQSADTSGLDGLASAEWIPGLTESEQQISVSVYDQPALQIAHMVAAVRKEDLRKVPGVAETLDWAATLGGLEIHDLRQEPESVHETMICLIKTHEDRARLTREVTDRLLSRVA